MNTQPPTPPIVLGLTGRAGAGKDTVAAYLEDHYGFVAIGFADPILDMLGALIQHVDVDGAWLIERALKEQPMPVLDLSYRHLAQTLGTEWGRNLIAPDLWVRIAAHRTSDALDMGNNVVITDVRFPNEAAWITATGGHIVRLQREALPSVRTHASEHAADALMAQHTIDNSGSKAALFDQIDGLIAELRRGQS